MSLYTRTFSALKPYWGYLTISSVSATSHAIFSGLMLWMIGPLLMTLFNVSSLPSGGVALSQANQGEVIQSVELPGSDLAKINKDVKEAESWLQSIRDSFKKRINSLVQSDTRRGTLINFCLLILGVALIKNILYYIQAFFMVWVQQSVMRSFRDRLFDKYQRLSLGYFHSRRTGDIISRVTNDVVVLNDSIDIGFNRLITDSVTVIVLGVSLFILSWELTLMASVILPVVFGFIWFIGKKMRKYSERTQQKMADVNSVLEEAVNNVRIVKAFSMEEFESGKFFRATLDYFKSLVRMVRIRHLSSPINDTLATIAGASIMYLAGTSIIEGSGKLDVGDFITFIIVMFSMIKPVKSLSQIHVKLQEGMAAASRVFEVLDTDEKIVQSSKARIIKSLEKSIRYENVSFSYIDNVPVLREINFEVIAGEVVAIVGPSGGGKSTLLDLLPRFYDPSGGRISIDGHDLKDLTLKSLRDLMGIVTQETYLFNDTILSNIAYGHANLPIKDVIKAAEMANAHQFISEFDKGYDTLVGNRGIMLSGGQRQRLAIARALLKNPQILIFDEATSALDTVSEKLVQEAIDRLLTDRTVLVIAHRLSTIKNADKILVIDSGQIVQTGRHEELVGKVGLYKNLYTMQFEGER